MAAPQKLADAGSEAVKASPPIAVIGATAYGMTLQDWVFVLTLLYLGVQIGWLLWKWYRALSTKGWTPKDE
jgi:hypothetical protein